MYNIYQVDQKRSKSELKDRKREIEDYLENKRKELQPKMLEGYKRRMENFATHVSDHPIVKKDSTNLIVKIRDEDPAKFLSTPCFKFTDDRDQRKKIRDSLEEKKKTRNEKYDFSRFVFRQRERSKEIQPGMRFQENGVEKIQKRLKEISPSDSFEMDLTEKNLKAMERDPVLVKKFIAKHYRKDLNQKTHFKAITSFALNLPDVLHDKYEAKTTNNANEPPPETDEDIMPLERGARRASVRFMDSNIQSSNDNSRFPILRKNSSEPRIGERRSSNRGTKLLPKLPGNLGFMTDPKTHTKLALLACNVIHNRNPNVNVLHKGEGHFTSEPEKTINELYQRYNYSGIKSDRISGSRTDRSDRTIV